MNQVCKKHIKNLLILLLKINNLFFLFLFIGFSKASDLIRQYDKTNITNILEEKKSDNNGLKYQKSKIPKISVENCSNININITFKCD